MRIFRRYTIVALAVVGLAASLPLLAQQSQSSDLTNKQAQELALTAKTPAEHAKLQNYFLALAAKYEAEAVDHAGLGQAEKKNPNPGSHFPGSAGKRAQHCDRLSGTLKEAAKDARELASEHGKMAQ